MKNQNFPHQAATAATLSARAAANARLLWNAGKGTLAQDEEIDAELLSAQASEAAARATRQESTQVLPIAA